MKLVKRTYTLPFEVVEKFEKAVPTGKRSAALVELITEKLEEERRVRLRRAIIKGCQEMSDVYLETEKEFHSLEEEVERAGNRDT